MFLSVIIPTHNRAEVLRRTLNLLANQTYPREKFEIIVINDGSTDATPDLLAEFSKKQIFTLRPYTQKNAGAGQARNLGIQKSQGQILVFLDNDILPKPNFLAKHAEFHTIFPEPAKAALGLTRLHPEALPQNFQQKIWLKLGLFQVKFQDLRAQQLVNYQRFYTGNLSLKKKFLGNLSFDSKFQTWGFEDSELGYRLQKKGLQLIYFPAACGLHLHELNPAKLLAKNFAAGKNAVLFQLKHPEANVLPGKSKLFCQKILVAILPFSFYAQAKKAFWSGIKARQKELAQDSRSP